MRINFLLALSFFYSQIYSQAPDIQWQRRFGGSAQNLSYSSRISSDGNYFIGGRSNSNISGDKSENSKGNYDYWIIEVDNSGNLISDKTIGAGSPPDFNGQDIFMSMASTSDGGYIACGYSNSPISGDKSEDSINESDDYWLTKINATGGIDWENTIGGDQIDLPFAVEQTADDGYIVGGYSQSSISGDKTVNSRGFTDFWILKLDVNGNIDWQKTFGGTGYDSLTTIVQTSQGYLFGGSSTSDISGEKSESCRGLSDYWLLFTDLNGTVLWQKTFGGNQIEGIRKVLACSSGGFLIAGSSDSGISGDKTILSRGHADYWIIKIDNFGAIEWQQAYGGSGDDNLYGASECQDGGYILTGTSDSPISGDKTEGVLGVRDSWTIKINQNGILKWQLTLGGDGEDGFNSVMQDDDGSYLLSGTTDSPVSGTITENSKGERDYWTVKLNPEQLSTDNQNINQVVIYPNPASNFVNVWLKEESQFLDVSITSLTGQLIEVNNFSNVSQFKISVDLLPTGIYFLIISSSANESHTYKLIKN